MEDDFALPEGAEAGRLEIGRLEIGRLDFFGFLSLYCKFFFFFGGGGGFLCFFFLFVFTPADPVGRERCQKKRGLVSFFGDPSRKSGPWPASLQAPWPPKRKSVEWRRLLDHRQIQEDCNIFQNSLCTCYQRKFRRDTSELRKVAKRVRACA